MFDIARFSTATSVAQAAQMLREDASAMIIAGGTDVLIRAREGKLRDAHLISIHDLPELTGVCRETDGTIKIGPATTFSVLSTDPILCTHLPWLAEACAQVGGPQTREAGTIGGNLVNGATSADSVPALLCMNAQLVLTNADGSRTVCATDFHTGPGKTVRQQDEILTEIRILPNDYEGFTGCYIKYGKRAAMEIATLGCAALVRLTDDKQTITDLRLAFGVAAPTPIRCHTAEQTSCGLPTTEIARIAKAALTEAHPRDSWRASAAFRTHLIPEIAQRAMAQAIVQAGGV